MTKTRLWELPAGFVSMVCDLFAGKILQSDLCTVNLRLMLETRGLLWNNYRGGTLFSYLINFRPSLGRNEDLTKIRRISGDKAEAFNVEIFLSTY
ncbi:hypothetical protein WN55_01183 [Dufourea novaeangliae]|uniref:Uncharacterized protein n=1 Tax=Dufourea novaeangliae TaxID=178035 RepID=A0A154PG77_DUFNO|nr:hypothetical protein WN55_01183 [Dufourea novaeangliae]